MRVNQDNLSVTQERLDHLEEINRWAIDSLELVVSLVEEQSAVSSIQDTESILRIACSHLKRLMRFHTLAFLTVNESDFDFKFSTCDPSENRDLVQTEIDATIDSGTFSWALGQNRVLILPAVLKKNTVILHALATRSTVMGIFVGIINDEHSHVTKLSSNLLSIVFFNCAQALENHSLYTMIDHYSKNLEGIVSTRTIELEAALKQARAAGKAREQFLANISHEIRTPLNGIIGMADLLSGEKLTSEHREYVETIQDSSEALQQILNDILDISKIDAGQLTVTSSMFNIQALIGSIVGMFAVQGEEKGLDFAIDYGLDVPEKIRGDSIRIRQVIVNLLSNAMKFTQHGFVTLSIQQVPDNDQDGFLEFVIEDSGIGIGNDKIDIVFDRFTQADSSTTREYGGTGLGLSISRKLVELMGGEIGVESTLGKGARFWFKLPVIQQVPSNTLPRKDLIGCRVLLVSETRKSNEIILKRLMSYGIRCDVAGSTSEGLVMLRSEADEAPYNIVIVNDTLLDIGGEEFGGLAGRIPNLPPLIKLVMLSMRMRGRETSLLSAGFDGCIHKPVCNAIFMERILKSVQHKQSPIVSTHPTVSKQTEKKSSKIDSSRNAVKVEVLVVEDHPVNQKVAVSILEKLGCRVEVANNGRIALESIKKRNFDIIFMDCQMPELDGFDATREIRKLENDKRHTIIVAMTANVLKGVQEKCKAVGMDDFISKPVKCKMIQDVLHTWVTSKT